MGVWLTGIVILLIVGILLDGWRRMRQGRQNNAKARSSPSPLSPSGDDYPSELPNGGARVVTQRRTEPKIGADTDWDDADSGIDDAHSDLDDAGSDWDKEQIPAPVAEAQPAQPSYLAPENQPHQADEHTLEPEPEMPVEAEPTAELPARDGPAAEPRIPQQVTLNLDESVPMLMESVEQQEEPEPPEPAIKKAPAREPVAETVPEPDSEARSPASPARPVAASAGHERGSPERVPEEAPEPEEVLVINVMAPAGTYFQGEALQNAIFDQGLRYGSMSIFHRYRDTRGGGPVQFSLANMVKPGTFDLDAMESFQTPGVSLFLTLPLEGDNVAAFDLMLGTAKTLAETLGGELKDENRSAMTRQTMEHDRQRVLDFVRRQLSRVPG